MISMSVAHTAIASTRTRTSVGPGSGTGFSTTDSSSGPPRTQAFIRSGMGYWLLREREPITDITMFHLPIYSDIPGTLRSEPKLLFAWALWGASPLLLSCIRPFPKRTAFHVH